MIIALAAGLVIGLVLGTLGGGGAILAVPVFVYIFGQDAQSAMVGALIVVALSSVTAVLTHARSGEVRWKDGIIFGLIGIAGSWLGSHLSTRVDPDWLLLSFGVLLLVVAALMVRRTLTAGASSGSDDPGSGEDAAGADAPDGGTADADADDDAPARRRSTHLVPLILTASAVGLLTGFFGVGGGFAVVPALVLALEVPMSAAVGTSLLVIIINSLAALGSRLGAGVQPDWSIVVPFALAAAVAGVAGAFIAKRLPEVVLSRIFAGLLVGVGAWMLVSSAIAVT